MYACSMYVYSVYVCMYVCMYVCIDFFKIIYVILIFNVCVCSCCLIRDRRFSLPLTRRRNLLPESLRSQSRRRENTQEYSTPRSGHMYVCMNICECMCMNVCVWMYACMNVCVWMWMYICRLHVCMNVCMNKTFKFMCVYMLLLTGTV